ncbi:putative XKS1-xylulokinase [Testicularia cyperi]|uniref:Xylulose kinase n=1 Tax=Testicularia cyperi TaxID=1882483 RepID=A0A317XMF4_9BASI|nr:putative XKS1-xylulokinase [Testicularia cyperi]
MTDTSPLFLGLDASTQALKASLLDLELNVLSELEVRFDRDLPHYGTTGGVLPHSSSQDEGTVVAPVMLYVEAIDQLADKIKAAQWPVSRIRAISAAGQQHASVYFSRAAPKILTTLSSSESLTKQVEAAFSRSVVPNWQDSSTGEACKAFEEVFGGAEQLAQVTGSKAHTRFTGPQIHKFRKQEPEAYRDTERIGLVSSFVTTMLCVGDGEDPEQVIKGIDESDACGMNLLDMRPKSSRSPDEMGKLEPAWNFKLLQLASGETEGEASLGGAVELEHKLGKVYDDAGQAVGKVGRWWVDRYGFSPDCLVFPGTGDNPATFLAFSLAERQAIVSLGTSDTVMVATSQYVPDPEFHAFVHPAKLGAESAGKFFNMLVYKSGSLAREWVRDQFCAKDWDTFNKDVETHGLQTGAKDGRVGFYWLRPEIIPAGASGLHRYTESDGQWNKVDDFSTPGMNAAAILETQFLNYRYRSSSIVAGTASSTSASSVSEQLPLSTIYAVGGASSNSTITQTMSDVFGSDIVKPVQLSDDGQKWVPANYNFCSVGAAYKAVWGYHRLHSPACAREEFDDFVHRTKSQAASDARVDPSSTAGKNVEGGVQVICTPRRERTDIYSEVIDQWKQLEQRALDGH